jgi:hypothetical protein
MVKQATRTVGPVVKDEYYKILYETMGMYIIEIEYMGNMMKVPVPKGCFQ